MKAGWFGKEHASVGLLSSGSRLAVLITHSQLRLSINIMLREPSPDTTSLVVTIEEFNDKYHISLFRKKGKKVMIEKADNASCRTRARMGTSSVK